MCNTTIYIYIREHTFQAIVMQHSNKNRCSVFANRNNNNVTLDQVDNSDITECLLKRTYHRMYMRK